MQKPPETAICTYAPSIPQNSRFRWDAATTALWRAPWNTLVSWYAWKHNPHLLHHNSQIRFRPLPWAGLALPFNEMTT